MKNFNNFTNLMNGVLKKGPSGEVKRNRLEKGSIEHPMSIHSASIEHPLGSGGNKVETSIKPCIWKYAAMMALLLTLACGNVWGGETILKEIDFTTAAWSGTTFSQGNTTTPDVINGITFYAKNSSSSNNFSYSTDHLVFPGNNYSSSNYVLGFPITGIVDGMITIRVWNGTTAKAFKYNVIADATEFASSHGDGIAATTGVPGHAEVGSINATKAYVYIGCASTSDKNVTKIVVSTPARTTLSTSSLYESVASTSKSVYELINGASYPDYLATTINAVTSRKGWTSSVSTPHDYTGVNSGTTYYFIKTANGSTITLRNIANVKSVRFYGNGDGTSANITTSVSKVSGSGSNFSVSNIAFDNSNKVIAEYTTGDMTGLSGYDAGTYYNYTFTFGGAFDLWGIYVEAAAAETSYTFPAGTTIYYDFTAISGGGNYNTSDFYNYSTYGTYDESLGGKLIAVTFASAKTIYTDQYVFKTGTGSWTDVNFTVPSSGQNVIICGSDGKSFTWGTATFAIAGEMNEWSTSANISTTGSLDIDLDAHTTYKFKVVYTGGAEKYCGISDTRISSSVSDYNCTWGGGDDIYLMTAGEGTYTFAYDFANNQLDVTYPTVTHPSPDYCYLQNYSWSNTYLQLYATNDSHATKGWPGQQLYSPATTTIGGVSFFYFAMGSNYTSIQLDDNGGNYTGYQTPTYGQYLNHDGSSWGWRKWSYTITLSNDGADTYPSNPSIEFCGTAPSSLTPPTKTGYTFGGYYNTSTCDDKQVIAANGGWNTSVAGFTDGSGKWIHEGGSATLYAKWTANEYTISLNRQSGSGGPASVTATYNSSSNLTSITCPTRSGYTFAGYYTLAYGSGSQLIDKDGNFNSDVTDYITDGKWTKVGGVTLYAYWKHACSATAYTIRYYNSGTVAYESACFEKVGSTHEWNIEDFAIPSQTKYSVGYNEDVYASDLGTGATKSSSAEKSWTDTYSKSDDVGNGAMQLLPVGASARAVGQATGALGTLVIWDDSKDKNLSVGFLPNGYGVTTADATYAFTIGDSYFCYTDPVTISSTEAAGNFQVKLQTSSSYAACAQGTSENASAVSGRKITGDADIANGKKGVFQMWQNSTANNFGLRFVTVHDVSFDLQGHGDAIDDYTNVRYNDKIVAPSDPSATGYTFGGWYKEAGCTNAWNFASDVVTEATILYAKWTIKTYTVTFESNNDDYGTVSPTSIASVPHGSEVSISSYELTLNGTTVTATAETAGADYTYAFSGWSVSDGDAITSAQTITATFTRTANSYTLAWDKNGGSTLTGDYTSGTTAYGTTLTPPDDPTRDGYTFTGWNSADDGTGDDYTGTMPAEDVTYYAQWEEIDYCYEFAPTLTSGNLSQYDVAVTSSGGILEYTPGGSGSPTLSYSKFGDNNGLLFGGASSSIVTIALKNNIQEGTIITAEIIASNNKSDRTLYLRTESSDTNLDTWTIDASSGTANDVETFTYTVPAKGALIGTNKFRIVRKNNAAIKSLKVSNCGSAATTYNVSHTLSHVSFSSGIDAGTGAAIAGGNYTAIFEADDCYTLPSTITVTIGGDTKTVNTDYKWDSSTGKLVIWGAKVTGNISITISGTDNHSAAGLSYGTASVSKKTTDEAFTNELSNPNSLTVSYESSDEEVAEVDSDGEVTIVGAGTCTITASADAQGCYNSGSASYTLTVTACTTPTVSWSTTPANGIVGGSMTAAVTTNYSDGLAYSVTGATPSGCVTINGSTGAMSYVKPGTATVKATVTGDGTTYCEGPAVVSKAIKIHNPQVDDDTYAYYYSDATHFDGTNTYMNPEGNTPGGSDGDNTALTTPWTIRSSSFMDGLTSIVATNARYDKKNNHINAYIKLRQTDGGKIVFTIAEGYEATIKIKMGGYDNTNTNLTMKLGDSGDNISYTGTMAGKATVEDSYAELTYADLAAGAYTLKPTSGSLYISQIDIETTLLGYAITNGNPSNGTIAITDGSSAITAAAEGATVTITATPSDGYSFSSWTVTDEDEGSVTVTSATTNPTTFTMPAKAVTVSATFTPNTYGITYHLNGASWTDAYSAPATYTVGTGATLPTSSNMTNTGYTFDGWKDNSSLTGDSKTTIGTSEYGDKEFWAKWTENTYTITYNANGGSGSTSSTNGHYVTVANNGFTYASHVFAGWNTKSGGDGYSYGEGDEIELTANMTLYAQWATDYDISWDASPKLSGSAATPNLGGGNYTIKASVSTWTGTLTTSMISSETSGVTITSVAVDNSSSPKTITATFNVGASVAGESISFTLDVPAAGVYGAKSSTKDFDIDRCEGAGGGGTTIFKAKIKSGMSAISTSVLKTLSGDVEMSEDNYLSVLEGGSLTLHISKAGDIQAANDTSIRLSSDNAYWEINISGGKYLQDGDIIKYVVASNNPTLQVGSGSYSSSTDMTLDKGQNLMVIYPGTIGAGSVNKLYIKRPSSKNSDLAYIEIYRPSETLLYMHVKDDLSSGNITTSGEESQTKDNNLAKLSSGTVFANSPTAGDLKIAGSSEIQLSQATGYLKLVLSKALAEGDILYFNSSVDKQISITSSATRATTNSTTKKMFQVPAASGLIGQSTIYLWYQSGTNQSNIKTIAVVRPGSGSSSVTPTLTWSPALITDGDWHTDHLEKETGDADFTYTVTQDKNSLGAITYSSSNTSVATVNATTGKVHIAGAAGNATITATMAESGCYAEATASYNITVVDNCEDVAGTIGTEDLGCDGIRMTVTGHTTSGATVSYQWYKDGATIGGATSATYTATTAGEYYVVVTNTGGGHCAMASTNTITVEATETASASKIVNSWYVKNGRRTPDVALVQTEDATGFYVKIGDVKIWDEANSVTTGFAGCGFYLGTDGIIYLKGQQADGSEPSGLTAGDVTLKFTATACGGNSGEVSITIHKQTETTYKEVAFVVDGTKEGAWDAVTSGHADGTVLYEYLDSVGTAASARKFRLYECNIYKTVDEQAIREYYSQFDAILITDNPDTGTKIGKKSCVNAFGTMVDIRPILTMEAWVSKLANWKAKGVSGNPESPNPRQYGMKLQCKDHAIFNGLSVGSNVKTETIEGVDYWTVLMVDSTKSPYSGVAYNSETSDKPALQGFAASDVSGLLLLGEISKGTLYAGVERQEEPAARLMLLGLNAKALPNALTDEGKIVIKNALSYLLETDMEQVDDCSNYFTGATSSDWNTATNWSKGVVPNSPTNKARILRPCVISSGSNIQLAEVDIATDGASSKIAGTKPTGKLTIEAGAILTVGGKIRAAEAPYFNSGDLKPTEEVDLVVNNTSSSNQAALIFNNDAGDTKATVNLYSIGRKVSETYQYQYLAIPMQHLPVNPSFAGLGIYTYVWLEASGWERRGYYDDVYAFEGLGITTSETTASQYEMKGTLASTVSQEIPITADGKRLNLIGNSWTAPIQISKLEKSDFGDASESIEQTVYIYCTGNGNATTAGTTETAGQWLAIPFSAAGFGAWDGLKVIPAMQAFQIKTSGAGTLTLDYDKHVRGGSTDLTSKLRAPKRTAAYEDVELMRIRVADSKTHTDLYLFEGEQFSDEFDNGWEANYRVGTNESAKLYARVSTGVMSVAAMSDLEGTPVYFIPGQETEYTFTFGGAGMGYYLNDMKLKKSTLISADETYSFLYEKGDAPARFYISRTPIDAPQTPTGVDNTHSGSTKVRKVIINDKVYIFRGGHMYSVDGRMVK